MKVGTRYSMFLGGALFGTAFATAGAGVAMHSLPLLYFGNCKLQSKMEIMEYLADAFERKSQNDRR